MFLFVEKSEFIIYFDTDRQRYAAVRHANQSSRRGGRPGIVVLFVRVKQINVYKKKKIKK